MKKWLLLLDLDSCFFSSVGRRGPRRRIIGQGPFCFRFVHAMPNPLRVAIKMPLARQRHPEKPVVDCIVIEAAAS
jgi:hypothetical protein